MSDALLISAKKTLKIESDAIIALAETLDESFSAACQTMMNCQGRIVVTGMGKSGHIANKIAATLASTGTPAFFVHPAEASHGDLGMITPDDVVLALSNSGTTSEIVTIVPLLKRMGVKLISMTGNPKSMLAESSDIHIDVSVKQEACPLDLAPTASTTAALALGDALAVSMLEARGFTAEDFAFSHPGGRLGRRLLLKVADIMHVGKEIPRVTSDAMARDALIEMSAKGLGMTTVLDNHGVLIGIFTDGDLRRCLDKKQDLQNTSIADIMTVECKYIEQNILAAEALNIMEENSITALIMLDSEHKPMGIIHLHDILRAGVA